MCAIAEITFPYLESQEQEFRELAKPIEGVIEKSKGQMKISLRSFRGNCLCEPEPGFQEALLDFLEALSSQTSPVYYSPNDYSENPEECQFLELTPKAVVSGHLPSLETKPTRILISSRLES